MREKYEADVAQWRRNVADRDKRIARLQKEIVTLPPEEEDSDLDDMRSWVEDSNEEATRELECLERYGPPKHPILWDGPLPEFDARINILEMNEEFPPREYCMTLERQVQSMYFSFSILYSRFSPYLFFFLCTASCLTGAHQSDGLCASTAIVNTGSASEADANHSTSTGRWYARSSQSPKNGSVSLELKLVRSSRVQEGESSLSLFLIQSSYSLRSTRLTLWQEHHV